MLSIKGVDTGIALINVRSNSKDMYSWPDLLQTVEIYCAGHEADPEPEPEKKTPVAPVQPTEEIPEEEEPEIQEDEEEKKVCIAQAYILYNSTQYKPGDVLPANDPEMLAAWLEAGTAKWLDETVVNSMKAQSVTALAGMYGTAVSSDSENGEELVGRVPHNHNSVRYGR